MGFLKKLRLQMSLALLMLASERKVSWHRRRLFERTRQAEGAAEKRVPEQCQENLRE